jgi:hypothetical protein
MIKIITASIKNLTITQKVGYLFGITLVCAIIFTLIYFLSGLRKHIKSTPNHESTKHKNESDSGIYLKNVAGQGLSTNQLLKSDDISHIKNNPKATHNQTKDLPK